MSGKSDTDPTWSLLFFLAAFGALGWFIWQIFQNEILTGLRYIRLAEFYVIGLFTHALDNCTAWLKTAAIGDKNMPTATAYAYARACFGAANLQSLPTEEALGYYNITLTSLTEATGGLAPYFRWPAIAGCAVMSFYMLYLSPRNKYKTRHTLETFIKFQSKMWPSIAPIVDFMPNKFSARIPGDAVPDKIPPFAEAFSPEEWLSYQRIPVVNGIPDREGTRRAFQAQLGPRWTGDASQMPLHMQAIFAGFALRGGQKREESEEFLGKIALCWSLKHGLVIPADLQKEISEILANPATGGKALQIANQHAYRTTALLGTLKWARFMGGVLAPATFLWLRAVDRDLWYPLNNLGRRSFHTEGAGAMAHFMAEQGAQKPLVIPRVETAIVTLNQYMGRSPVKVPPREEPNATGVKKKS